MAILVNGAVRIVIDGPQRDYILRIMGHGGVLGEISALQGCPHTATVRTHQDCDLLCFAADDFTGCLCQAPHLQHNLLLMDQQSRCRLSRQAAARAMCSIPGQLALQLVFLAEDFGEKNARGDLEIPLRLTRQTLAALLGVCRDSAGPALLHLVEQKFLSVSDEHYITVHDLNALQAQC